MISSILTWNLGCFKGSGPIDNKSAIARRAAWLDKLIVEKKHPTVVLLQEATTEAVNVLQNLGYYTTHAGDCVSGVGDQTWVRDVTVVPDGWSWGMPVRFVMQGGAKILIANIHLPSRTKRQEADIELRVSEIRDFLVNQRKIELCTEVVAGDFNLVPYNRKMMTRPPEGLGGNRCAKWIGRRFRHPKEYRELLNATWQLEGRIDCPLASYHYDSGTDAPWYQYDQVMLSSEFLLSRRIETTLIDSIAGTDLTKKSRYREPDPSVGSDHLPVLVRLAPI